MLARSKLTFGLALLLAAVASAHVARAQGASPPPPTSIDYAMYFGAMPKDGAQCALKVVENERKQKTLVAAAPVTNPAMTCPDMFSWKLFVDSIRDGFLQRWATDPDTFPGNGGDVDPPTVFPWPLCGAGITTNCCQPGGKNDPAHCPFFPGAGLTTLDAFARPAPVRRVRVPALMRLHAVPSGARAFLGLAADAHAGFATVPTDDPTRKLRQEQRELVFRNEPMLNYIFLNGIYYAEGVETVFTNNQADIQKNAPFHRPSTARSLTAVDLPTDAVMIKANFITKEQAEGVGLKEDPAYPFLKMRLLPTAGSTAQEYWLISFHVSSKDTPNWVWTTFEYVGNIGRCDFIGCNDSYGFAAPATLLGRTTAGNYTPPHTTSDGFKPAPSVIYSLNGTYPPEVIRPALQAVFDQMDIGTGPNEVPPSNLPPGQNWFPTSKDKAWRSYRLKGSQVNFTDSAGRTLLLGNSVTEAGFVTRSSCATCHARASINAAGDAALGVFEPETDFQGYLMSSHGTPNPAWYNLSKTSPLPLAVQTDFIWGMAFTNHLKSGGP
jgi:hypothetical protein